MTVKLIPGDVFTITYPFVRGEYVEGGFATAETPSVPSWLPGVEWRDITAEDSAPFADAEGKCLFTVVGTFKPGHYPERVFYTRKFVDPDGKEFGKTALRIATLDKFRRLAIGYRDDYGLGDEAPPQESWSGHGLRQAREAFETGLAEMRAANPSPPMDKEIG